MQNDSKLTLVIDLGNPQCDGKLLDRESLTKISHTLLPFYEFAKMCKEKNMPCITPDAFLSQPLRFKGKRVLLLSHLVNDRTDLLIEKGAEPFLLMCQESPFIATRFYMNFKSISKKFRYTMGFSGMKKLAHPDTEFITMHFPIATNMVRLPTPLLWEDKKAVTLIAMNKKANMLKVLPLIWLYGKRVRLIYPLRQKMIAMLAHAGLIDIYGGGWEHASSPDTRAAIRGGPILDGTKVAMLGRYKFTLCFENAIFPGYVTEKIFDAFLAGSVPIYLGDPDVEKIIPAETFIDVRDFPNLEDLLSYIRDMDKETYQTYQAHIQTFLSSETFKEFTQESFIQKIYGLLETI